MCKDRGGNTRGNLASITEVDIYAADDGVPPPPPPPPPGGDVDPFGIVKIYLQRRWGRVVYEYG